MELFEMMLTAGLWASVIRIATPLIFATLGELICERAGVLNLGIEGIMTIGAMAGWIWVYQGGDLWGGIVFAAIVGMVFGLLHSLLVVYLGLSQHVSGIGITLLASSISYYAYTMLIPFSTTPPKIVPFSTFEVPLLSSIPIIGEAFFNQSALTYLAYILVIVTFYVLYKMPIGLTIRMAGENPVANEAQGINVLLIRTGAVMAGSALMAIGGAFLTMSAFDAFYFGMINGRGWICIALVIFASWKPGKAFLGAILFALFEALQIRAQLIGADVIPYQIFSMMPYFLSIVAMMLVARKAAYPKALLVPFRQGDRI
jgi:simple sugar transport system permease protein